MPDIFDDIAPDQKPPDAVVARGRDIFDEISPDPLPYRDYAAERPGAPGPDAARTKAIQLGMPLPEEMKTDAQVEAERRAAYAPTFVNPRTGRPSYGTGGAGPISWATDWWKGAPEIVAGAEQLAGPTAFQFPGAAGAQAAIKATQGERVPLPMTREDFLANRQPGTRPVTSDDLLREAAGGAHQIIGGAFQLATPLIGGEMAANPVGTAVGLGTGMAAQEGVRAGLQALGLPEEYAEVAGDLAGVIVGAGSLSAYNRMLLRAKLRPYLQERMNMAYAQAQAYERAYRGGRLLEAGQPEAGEAAPAPGPAPAGGDIFDSIAPGEAQPAPQLGEQARLLRGATPGEPGPVRQMGTGRFPGQPGEVIPQGPAYGLPRALPPVEDPGTPLGRVEKGLARVQDLSEPELIEFMRQLDARLKAVPPTPPQLPSAPPAAPNERQEPSQAISPTSETPPVYKTEKEERPLESTRPEKFVEGSHYDTESPDAEPDAVAATYEQTLDEQRGRLSQIDNLRQQIQDPKNAQKPKTLWRYKHQLAQIRRSYDDTWSEVGDAFGQEWIDRGRREIEPQEAAPEAPQEGEAERAAQPEESQAQRVRRLVDERRRKLGLGENTFAQHTSEEIQNILDNPEGATPQDLAEARAELASRAAQPEAQVGDRIRWRDKMYGEMTGTVTRVPKPGDYRVKIESQEPGKPRVVIGAEGGVSPANAHVSDFEVLPREEAAPEGAAPAGPATKETIEKAKQALKWTVQAVKEAEAGQGDRNEHVMTLAAAERALKHLPEGKGPVKLRRELQRAATQLRESLTKPAEKPEAEKPVVQEPEREPAKPTSKYPLVAPGVDVPFRVSPEGEIWTAQTDAYGRPVARRTNDGEWITSTGRQILTPAAFEVAEKSYQKQIAKQAAERAQAEEDDKLSMNERVERENYPKPDAERHDELHAYRKQIEQSNLSPEQKHNALVDADKLIEYHKPAAIARAEAEIGAEKPGAPKPAPPARPEPNEAEFQKAYQADLETFRKQREAQYPSEELMDDWNHLKEHGAVSVNHLEHKRTSTITTQKRIEGKGKKRKEITSYIVDVARGRDERSRYTYDWEPDGSNDWAAAKALAQARGIPGISNDLHAAMMNRGEYVQWHERLYAIRNALKAAMPGVKIPDLSTAVKPGENVTLKRAIELVAESLPRNLGDVSVPRPGSYLTSDEKYYGELRDKLKPYQERLEAAAAVAGRDHPRVEELQKLIDQHSAAIDRALEDFKEASRKRQEEAAEKLKDAAERDVKRGARFGGEPGERLKEYAKAKGWKSEGDALQAQAEKHFGVKRNLLEPSDISGLKLKKHELDILREANLDPEGTLIPRRLTIGQAQELRAKGLIDAQATKLTEAGERAALAVRAADEAKQAGQPISEYKPGRGVVPDPGEGRFAITAPIPVKGGKYHDKGVWHTDGHFAAAGEPPKNWSEPPPGERNLPEIDRVIPKEPGEEVKPVGFGDNPDGTIRGKFNAANTLIYFSNRGAVNSVYYDYLVKRYAPDKWTSAEGPKGAYQAWKNGKQVAVLMPMKVEKLPPNIEKLMPAQPAEGAGKKLKKALKSEKGSISIDLATLGLAKFFRDDVVPTLKAAGAGIRAAQDDLLAWLAPAARGPEAKLTALSTRANAAELARSTDRAQAALRVAGKFFDSQDPEDNYRFMERIEAGEPQPNEDLQAIADVMRKMLDTRREAIRALGTGKLESFIENYFPHIWKEPEAWSQMWENLKKRPMEGSKSFLKKRTIDSISAGLERGLEPISDNPVDLVLMKSREMDKYLMAHRILKELKERGIARFLDAREFLPKGYAYIDDKIATVFGRPSVTAHESYDPHVMERLEQLAESLGIPHERVTKLKSEGLAIKGKGVKTKFGSPESVLAHEIGHQLEWRYNLTARLKNLAKKQGVKGVAEELRNLADLRFEGLTPDPAYREYVRDKDEKMANAIAALVYAPKKFQQTAPETWDLLRDELWHIPELKPLFDIEPSMVLKGRQAQIEIPGLVIKGHFVAPEPAATVLNNYLSPGLREKSGLFRAYLGAANFLNQAQLGWSAFHAGFTTAEAMVSRFALGIYQAAKGSPLKGLRSMATTPIAPFTNVLTGHRMVKEWEAENAGGDPWITKMVDAVVTAGGRGHMEQFYATKITENMMKAFRRGNIAGGVLRLPGAAMEQAIRPIMEWLVPRQKMAAFADLASFELERLGPDASTDDVRAALARAWDSIDNRFGQLVYDNLFWDKVWKDAAMASVRSVGWNVGTIRELGGAVPDTAKFSTGKGDFTPRMAYMLALPVVAALMGATLYYLWHGEAPKHLADYYFPPDSHGQRWSLPTYVKDIYHWLHDPVRTAKGKIHPFLGLILDMLSNRDFANKPIRNPNHPLVKQAQELAKHAAQTAVPLSVKSVQQNKQKGLQETALPFVGITPAPKDISQPANKQTRGRGGPGTWGGTGAWSPQAFPQF